MTTDGPGGAARDLRYTRDVGPGDAGIRVVLRRRLAAGGMGDLLGELLSWQDGVATVLDRHGVTHAVAGEDVVAAKRIPPPPERRG